MLIEDSIDSVITSYESVERSIVEGSDEHLDLILDVQGKLSNVTNSTIRLVNVIERDFNTIDRERAKEIIVKLLPCFRIAYQIIGNIKRHFIYNSVKNYVTEFEREVNELKEFISDLSRYKVQENSSLIAMFNDEM